MMVICSCNQTILPKLQPVHPTHNTIIINIKNIFLTKLSNGTELISAIIIGCSPSAVSMVTKSSNWLYLSARAVSAKLLNSAPYIMEY